MWILYFAVGAFLGFFMAFALMTDGAEMHVAFKFIFIGVLAFNSGVAWVAWISSCQRKEQSETPE
jgi:hypothetical protein